MAPHHAILDEALTRVAEGKIKRLIVEMPPRHGKALEVSTPILTPRGFKPIVDLKPGDRVCDEFGELCSVVGRSEVWRNRPAFRVTVDGDSIIADAEHEWCIGPIDGPQRLFTTRELFDQRHMLDAFTERRLLGHRKRISFAVEPYIPVDTVCIEVDSPSHLFLAGRSLTPTHNSELCSRYFPAWYGMKFSGRDLIVTGADATLSEEFSKSARDLVEEHGPSMFGVDLHPTRRRVDDWELTNGTRVRAAGVGGSIMGRGADVLLIDDYLKNIEQALSPTIRRKLLQWYLTTAKTRLSPDGAVVMIATRWHKEDLIGEMLKSQGTPDGDQWVRICLPAEAEENDPLGRERGAALWPGRWTLDKLTAIRREYELRGYGWMYQALYQQRPPSVLDATWAEELLEGDDLWFDEWPHPSHIDARIMSLDPSLGETKQSDFSAIVMLALVDGLLFVDVDMDRRDPFRITEDSLQNCLLFNPNVFAIESNQFQAFLASYFEAEAEKRKMLVPVVTLHNRMKKAERIRAGLTSYLRRRQIRFKRNSPGVALLLEQLRGFPSHDHDDGPDALEMAIRMAQLVHSGEVPLEA